MCSVRTPWKLILGWMVFTVMAFAPRIVHASPLSQSDISQFATATGEPVRLMVKVDTMAAQAEVFSIPSAPNASDLAKVGWRVIEVDPANLDQTIAELQATEGVVEITPDYPLELAWDPDDPSYTRGDQWALEKMRTDIAWEFSAGSAITVAVIDSGIDLNHPDLAGRIVPGYNFIDNNTDTVDQCGHGTHVAGIVAAQTNNAVGVAGVAHKAVIMPIKVMGESCRGSYSRLMQGIIYAVDSGVRVISITSGGSYEHAGLHDAIKYAREKGVFVAVSAGNRASDLPFYPGSFEESFTVSGTDVNDQKYNNSNFGQQIDIAAPAVNILSTYWNANDGSTYAYLTGTSMAAPYVAAVAALVLEIDPKLPLADLEETLINSSVDLGDAGWDQQFGWGRLTAWRAVAAVTPAAGNIRLGHFRVPNMAEFDPAVTITATSENIQVAWALAEYGAQESVVVYRSLVPVFEAAEDVAKIATAANGSYIDTDVEAEQSYYYWLVRADSDVEIAITASYTSQLASAPVEPETPEEPEIPEEPHTPGEPMQPSQVAIYMPLVQR